MTTPKRDEVEAVTTAVIDEAGSALCVWVDMGTKRACRINTGGTCLCRQVALAAIAALDESRADPWVDTRIVRFDDTVVFGLGGFDFERWESLRWEMHTMHGSYAVWKSGNRTWSMYGTANGVLVLDRYSCEANAKADAEQYALSLQATIDESRARDKGDGK